MSNMVVREVNSQDGKTEQGRILAMWKKTVFKSGWYGSGVDC